MLNLKKKEKKTTKYLAECTQKSRQGNNHLSINFILEKQYRLVIDILPRCAAGHVRGHETSGHLPRRFP